MLKTYTGEKVAPMGKLKVNVKYEKKGHTLCYKKEVYLYWDVNG